ncbi:wall-associated receptor kinase 2-like [Rosa rugosa]|uniref:wall-associated receptor kinase 2-like n=1 Tax=Rosa rugosa TaxID=74645 RepID=UPI002B40D925|nr:wall-associated receptor kinase 2-like [Rosa rugosa]
MALRLSLVAILLLLLAASTTTTTAAPAQAKSGCSDKCGNLTIPYPFGMHESCYLRKEFFIYCDKTTQPPTAYLMNKYDNIIVRNISLEAGELHMLSYIGRDCYDEKGNRTDRSRRPRLWLPPPYTISDTQNKFYAVGCDTYAIIRGFRGEEEFITGCMSLCNSLGSVDKNSCSGVGCCQTNIPSGLHSRTVSLSSYYKHSYVRDFNPCSYAFIAEQGQFNFSLASFDELNNTEQIPLVANWAIGNETHPCDEAQKRKDIVCKANSSCVNSPHNGLGYLCQCLPGYEGNPYHPVGCQDFDECKASNPCQNGKCSNSPPGNYTCVCHKGYKHDGMNDKSCIKDDSKRLSEIFLLLIVTLGVSAGFLVSFIGIAWLWWGNKKRQFIKLKEKYFRENGGLLLQQQLASHGGSVDATKIFSAEELQKATNNYHESRVLGKGGYGIVYKGILPDNQVIAIKKSKGCVGSQSEQFVNEVIILSQINHRNVVKLLGCCLETEVPILVYEFISHGTLHEHIHKKRPSLSFELRMKIAAEAAGALAHLHSSISTPIIHRDVKAGNILLDGKYMAKVSDFGASRLVSSGEAGIQTVVLGTIGYLDPEYLHSNQLTEKSDVYSFGVLLAELLTSKVAVSKDKFLASIFVSSMEKDCLNQVLDDEIVNEGNIEMVKNVAKLARRCLRVKGEERPTMREVAMDLEGMIMTKHPWGSADHYFPEETEYLLGSPNTSKDYSVNVGGCGRGTASGSSMQIDMSMSSYADGR